MRAILILVLVVLASVAFFVLSEDVEREAAPARERNGSAPPPAQQPEASSPTTALRQAPATAPTPEALGLGPPAKASQQPTAKRQGDAGQHAASNTDTGPTPEQPSDLSFWAGFPSAPQTQVIVRESAPSDEAAAREEASVDDEVAPPDEAVAAGSSIAMGEKSYVYVGSQRTPISAADVGSLRVDTGTRSFELQQLALPTVDFPSGESFEFLPVDISGQISSRGDVLIPVSVTVTTPAGLSSVVDLAFTTMVSSLTMPDGTRVDYHAEPFVGNDSATLVGSALLPDGIPIVVVIEVGN